ncbi:hypothetical protein EYF80_002539 [Liparis tanakae]|uniref:Uncharacterized protein n=1 Tax=Liparis tanakae TaxID=230148 RepID=A0A4Z2JCK0_9TELE|nr:hypothetical protein EYF80_002539 [Liparis tanakae]
MKTQRHRDTNTRRCKDTEAQRQRHIYRDKNKKTQRHNKHSESILVSLERRAPRLSVHPLRDERETGEWKVTCGPWFSVVTAGPTQVSQAVPLLQQRLLQAALPEASGVQGLDELLHLLLGGVAEPLVEPIDWRPTSLLLLLLLALRGPRAQHVLRQAEAVVLHQQRGGGGEEPVAAVQPVPAQRQQAGAGRRPLDPLLQLSNLRHEGGAAIRRSPEL